MKPKLEGKPWAGREDRIFQKKKKIQDDQINNKEESRG